MLATFVTTETAFMLLLPLESTNLAKYVPSKWGTVAVVDDPGKAGPISMALLHVTPVVLGL